MPTASRFLAFFLLFAVLGATANGVQNPSLVSTTPANPPAPVQPADEWSVSTGIERWSLDEAPPATAVLIAGQKVSFGDRQINESAMQDGGRQLMFPISWYGPYQTQNLDIRSIVVRYAGAHANMIMIDYVPGRVADAEGDFKYDPKGERYYRDLAFVQRDGRFYVKQAIAKGAQDGNGNFWIDAIVMYTVAQPAPATEASAKRAN